jgi:glucokinase
VGGDGEVLGEVRTATEAQREPDAILDNIVRAAHEALSKAGLEMDESAGVGIGSPGPLDIFEGVLISPVNLPTMHGVRLADRLSERLDTEVAIDNDANCLGLAEARFGAGQGADVCAGFTLGTGLGCFLVVRGEVYHGSHGAGLEIWCSPYLGDRVEEKVSGRGVARNCEKLSGERFSAAEAAQRARAGEGAALEAWREFGRDLAVPLAYLCNVTDPDAVVLGGSIAKAWDLFSAEMLEEAMKYVNPVTREAVRIVPAELGDAAGMLGAAALALDVSAGASPASERGPA